MLDKIDSILRDKYNILPTDVLLLGLSGGPDSLCLLDVLQQLGYPLIAMHINHKLREEADDEGKIVRQYTDRLNVELITSITDVREYAEAQSTSIEEAARSLRYSLLFHQAEVRGAKAVVVGHNANDQVETIILHVIHGTGLSGLRGMESLTVPNPWSNTIPLLRPLLSTWRVDIQRYLESRGLVPIIDQSNLDISFFRNRVRHELIPLLKSYHPSIEQRILRMGESIKDDYWFLQQLAEEAMDACLIRKGDGYYLFRTADFFATPKSLQRYILRRAMAGFIPGLIDVSFECIERGIACLMVDHPRGQTDLVNGIRLINEGAQFWVAMWNADIADGEFPALPEGAVLALNIPATLRLRNDWQLEATLETGFATPVIGDQESTGPYTAWLDVRCLHLPMSVRTRKPGDQITPLGMAGHSMKISDVMVNQKIPARARSNWPLVCSGEEIVWVPGYRISDRVRLRKDTKTALKLTLRRVLAT